jgi:hypothetical protein
MSHLVPRSQRDVRAEQREQEHASAIGGDPHREGGSEGSEYKSHSAALPTPISLAPVGDADWHLALASVSRGLRQRAEGVGDFRHGSLRVFAFAAVGCVARFAAPVFRAANDGEVACAWGIDGRLGTQNRPLHIGAQGLALDASDALDCRAHLSGNPLLPLVHSAACLA